VNQNGRVTTFTRDALKSSFHSGTLLIALTIEKSVDVRRWSSSSLSRRPYGHMMPAPAVRSSEATFLRGALALASSSPLIGRGAVRNSNWIMFCGHSSRTAAAAAASNQQHS